jgi:hypothetical protein
MPLEVTHPGADRRGRAGRIAAALALASFLIYAAAALLVYHDRTSQYAVERSSLAAAVSTIVYDAPVGAVYSGVLAELLKDFDHPLQPMLARLAQGDTPLGNLVLTNGDGNGIGYPVFATVALELFGIRLEALGYGFLCLVGLSAAAFILRYRDGRLLFAPLVFLTFTVMLFTPVASTQGVLNQAFFGGIRYFSLAAILPALHLLLELGDPQQPSRRRFAADLALASVQLFVLFVAILVRGSPGYNLIGIAVICLALLFRRRRDRDAVRSLMRKAGSILLIGAAMASVIYLWVPASYNETGRITGIVWHRVIVSLTLNPAWPFGDLQTTYRCRQYLPDGLAEVAVDQTGHCLWISYAVDHNMSEQQLIEGVYDGEYESVMRHDFVYILENYPEEVFNTFFKIKPVAILKSITDNVRITSNNMPTIIVILLAWEILAVFLVWHLVRMRSNGPAIDAAAGPIALLTILSFVPPMVAWGTPSTIWDNLFYVLFDSTILFCALLPMLKPSRLRRGYDAVLRLVGVETS